MLVHAKELAELNTTFQSQKHECQQYLSGGLLILTWSNAACIIFWGGSLVPGCLLAQLKSSVAHFRFVCSLEFWVRTSEEATSLCNGVVAAGWGAWHIVYKLQKSAKVKNNMHLRQMVSLLCWCLHIAGIHKGRCGQLQTDCITHCALHASDAKALAMH